MRTLIAALICISLLGCDSTEAKRPAKPTLLAFGASWCGPCHEMEPILMSLEGQGFRIRRIDIDLEPEVAAKYGVSAVPTFLVTKKGGDCGRIIGKTTRAKLVELCRKA